MDVHSENLENEKNKCSSLEISPEVSVLLITLKQYRLVHSYWLNSVLWFQGDFYLGCPRETLYPLRPPVHVTALLPNYTMFSPRWWHLSWVQLASNEIAHLPDCYWKSNGKVQSFGWNDASFWKLIWALISLGEERHTGWKADLVAGKNQAEPQTLSSNFFLSVVMCSYQSLFNYQRGVGARFYGRTASFYQSLGSGQCEDVPSFKHDTALTYLSLRKHFLVKRWVLLLILSGEPASMGLLENLGGLKMSLPEKSGDIYSIYIWVKINKYLFLELSLVHLLIIQVFPELQPCARAENTMLSTRNKVYSPEGRWDKETSIFCGVGGPCCSDERLGAPGTYGRHAQLDPGHQEDLLEEGSRKWRLSTNLKGGVFFR